jgi:hypothetical protein
LGDGDKGVRRAWIAERYRIIALVGDDLRDFIDRPIFAARRAELEPLFGIPLVSFPGSRCCGSCDRSLASDVSRTTSGQPFAAKSHVRNTRA